MTEQALQASLIGEEILLLAEEVLTQAKFASLASKHKAYTMPDGRMFEVSVAAMDGQVLRYEEPQRS